jgi:hypothetical protein
LPGASKMTTAGQTMVGLLSVTGLTSQPQRWRAGRIAGETTTLEPSGEASTRTGHPASSPACRARRCERGEDAVVSVKSGGLRRCGAKTDR